MADVQILAGGAQSAPLAYTLNNLTELIPKACYAVFNGAGASGPFQPCLVFESASGAEIARLPVCQTVAAGGSAAVSWFPDVGPCCNQTSSSGTGGGGTLSPTGVAAGTYGDATHVAQVTVQTDGRISAASSIAIPGGAGGMTQIFDQTLGVAAASIDTGAGGIPGGYSGLMIAVYARADGAFFSGSFSLQFNGDSTANNYQLIWTNNSNGVSSSFLSHNVGAIKTMEGPGANVDANVFGASTVTIPNYDNTVGYKAATALGGFVEAGAGDSELVHLVSTWLSTAAITQVKLITGIGNLVAGSRMTIYGLP